MGVAKQLSLLFLLLSRLRAVAFGIYEIFGNCALARSLATQLCRSSLCVVVVAVAIMLLVLLGLSANWSIKYALKHVHHLWSRVVSCIVIHSLFPSLPLPQLLTGNWHCHNNVVAVAASHC